MGPSMPRTAGRNFVQRAFSTGTRLTNIWDCPADVLPLGAQARDKPCIGRVWESGGNSCQPLDPCVPFLDHGREPFFSFASRADKPAYILILMAVAHRKGCMVEDLASMQFATRRADDPAFLRLGEVSHARAVVTEHVEEVRDTRGWALVGKVICIPGLDDG